MMFNSAVYRLQENNNRRMFLREWKDGCKIRVKKFNDLDIYSLQYKSLGMNKWKHVGNILTTRMILSNNWVVE